MKITIDCQCGKTFKDTIAEDKGLVICPDCRTTYDVDPSTAKVSVSALNAVQFSYSEHNVLGGPCLPTNR